jgi:hypothetical protein
MSKRAYLVVMALFLVFAAAFQRGRNPFGREFVTVFLPSLFFLNSLHWFVLREKVRWRVLGFCSSLLGFSYLYHLLYVRSQGKDLADFATLLLLILAAQILAFWFLTSDTPTRTISIAINSGTLFLVFLGVFLNTHGIETLGFSRGRFLLLSPLGAMLLSVSSAAYKWNLTTQVIFVCTIVQIGMGLLVAGDANGISWMSACSVLAVFAALGCAAYWAREWNK